MTRSEACSVDHGRGAAAVILNGFSSRNTCVSWQPASGIGWHLIHTSFPVTKCSFGGCLCQMSLWRLGLSTSSAFGYLGIGVETFATGPFAGVGCWNAGCYFHFAKPTETVSVIRNPGSLLRGIG